MSISRFVLRGTAMAAAFVMSSQASAQNADAITVTASRSPQLAADALPSTRVITRRDIDSSTATDLPSLLRNFTSVDVAQTGPLGAQTSVFLRGADSRQTLVLVDGVPMNRADFGVASWQHLPLDQIERVEIVRSNMSSLYGSQAVGGVVQVITRRSGKPQVTVGGGSQGTARVAASGGTNWGEGETATQLAGSLSHQRTSGFSAGNAAANPFAHPDRDPAEQSAVSANLEQGWAPGHRTRLSLMSSRTKSAYDGGFDEASALLDDEVTTRLQSVGLESRHRLLPTLELGIDLGHVGERFDDPNGAYTTGGRNRVRLAGTQLQWDAAQGQRLQLGAEAKRERFGDSFTAARTRKTESVRGGWTGQWGAVAGDAGAAAWQAQANVRGDRSDAYGRATTGLLALAHQPMQGLKLSAQLSSGFSAPSFVDEQYANPATQLRAERSRQAEFAVQWTSSLWQGRAAWFEQRQRDRLSFDPVTFETINIARARNRGLELMGESRVGPGTLGLDATFQDPRDRDTDKQLKRRARASLAMNYRVPMAGGRAAVYLHRTGKRLDTDPVIFGDADNPARTTLDLAWQRPLSAHWQLGAKVSNLGGSHATEVLGFTPPPRAWTLQLTGTL